MPSATKDVPGGNGAAQETDRLIASDKIEGSDVHNRQGEQLGAVSP
jgi:hypothetical protein